MHEPGKDCPGERLIARGGGRCASQWSFHVSGPLLPPGQCCRAYRQSRTRASVAERCRPAAAQEPASRATFCASSASGLAGATTGTGLVAGAAAGGSVGTTRPDAT